MIIDVSNKSIRFLSFWEISITPFYLLRQNHQAVTPVNKKGWRGVGDFDKKLHLNRKSIKHKTKLGTRAEVVWWLRRNVCLVNCRVTLVAENGEVTPVCVRVRVCVSACVCVCGCSALTAVTLSGLQRSSTSRCLSLQQQLWRGFGLHLWPDQFIWRWAELTTSSSLIDHGCLIVSPHSNSAHRQTDISWDRSGLSELQTVV